MTTEQRTIAVDAAALDELRRAYRAYQEAHDAGNAAWRALMAHQHGDNPDPERQKELGAASTVAGDVMKTTRMAAWDALGRFIRATPEAQVAPTAMGARDVLTWTQDKRDAIRALYADVREHWRSHEYPDELGTVAGYLDSAEEWLEAYKLRLGEGEEEH